MHKREQARSQAGAGGARAPQSWAPPHARACHKAPHASWGTILQKKRVKLLGHILSVLQVIKYFF